MSLFSGIRKKLESFGNRAIAQIDRNDGGRTAFNYNQQRFTQPQRPQPRPQQVQAPRPQQSIYSRIGSAASGNSFTRPLATFGESLAKSTFKPEQVKQFDKDPLEGLKAITAEVLSPTNIARANPAMAPAQLNTAAQKAVGIKGPNAQKIVNTGIDKFNQSRFGNGDGIYKATSFAANNFVAPIVKSGARFSDVSSGRDKYEKGIKGFSQYGTDAFNVGSAIYTPIKAGVLAKGGMPALKAVPGAIARGAGAGVGINVVDQLNRGTKIKDLNAKEALLTGVIGAGANVLPGATGFIARGTKSLAPKIGKATAKTAKAIDNKLMENPKTRAIEDTINTKKLLYDNASPSQRNILNREIAQLRQEANAIKSGGYASVPIGKDVSKGLSNEQADFINNYANMIEDMGSGNGVDINPATGTRVSNNVRLGDTKGKNMTKADWFDEARRQIESGEAMYDAGTDYKALPGLAKEAPQVVKTGNYLDTNTSQQVLNKSIQPKSELWSRWFKQSDYKALPEIEQDILKNPQIKDAGTSRMYDYYKEMFGEKMTYDEFLNKDVTLYRGGDTRATNNMTSYSLLERKAKRFGDVSSITVKPKDTYGMLGDFSEGEVFVPKTKSGAPIEKTPQPTVAVQKPKPVDPTVALKQEARKDTSKLATNILQNQDVVRSVMNGGVFKMRLDNGKVVAFGDKTLLSRLGNDVGSDVTDIIPVSIGRGKSGKASTGQPRLILENQNALIQLKQALGETTEKKQTVTERLREKWGEPTTQPQPPKSTPVQKVDQVYEAKQITENAIEQIQKAKSRAQVDRIYDEAQGKLSELDIDDTLKKKLADTQVFKRHELVDSGAEPSGVNPTRPHIPPAETAAEQAARGQAEFERRWKEAINGKPKVAPKSDVVNPEAPDFLQVNKSDLPEPTAPTPYTGPQLPISKVTSDLPKGTGVIPLDQLGRETIVPGEPRAITGKPQKDAVVKDVLEGISRSRGKSGVEGSLVASSVSSKAKELKVKLDQNFIDKYQAGKLTTPAEKQLAAHIKSVTDEMFKKQQLVDPSTRYRSNYVPQAYKNTEKEVADATARLQRDTGAGKSRVFETYAEARKYGLTPASNTLDEMLGISASKAEKVLQNRDLVKKGIEGGVLSTDMKMGTAVNGITDLQGNQLYAAKPVADMLNGVLQKDSTDLGRALHKVAKAFETTQDVLLQGGIPGTNANFFVAGQLAKDTTRNIGKGLLHPVQAIKQEGHLLGDFFRGKTKTQKRFAEGTFKANGTVIKNADFTREMSARGLDISPQTALSGAGKSKVRKAWNTLGNNPTFGRYMPNRVLSTAQEVYAQSVKKLGHQKALDLAAETTKTFTGHVDTILKGRSNLKSDAMATALFAPKYRESIIGALNNVLKSTYPNNWKNPAYKPSRQLLAGMAVTLAGYEALNRQLTGHSMMENRQGQELSVEIPYGPKDEKGNQKVVNIPFMPGFMTLPRAAASAAVALKHGDVKGVVTQASKALSAPLQTAGNILGNQDYFGRPIYLDEKSAADQGVAPDNALQATKKIALYAGGQFSPAWVRGMIDKASGKPTEQAIATALEAPVRFGKALNPSTTAYFKDRDEVYGSLNKNDKAIWDAIHPPIKKNVNGDYISDKTVWSGAARAANYLNNPSVLQAENEMAARAKARGEKVDPLFGDLKGQQQLVALTIDTLPPKDPQKAVLKQQNSWYQDYADKRGKFYDSLPPGDPNKPKAPIAYPEPNQQVATIQNAYYQLKDPTMKRQMMEDNPDLVEQFAKEEQYSRAVRAAKNLPQYDKYPQASKDVQNLIDFYSALPKKESGGKSRIRSAWIKSHPNEWAKMTEQFSKQAQFNLQQDASLASFEGQDLTEKGIKSITSLAKSLGMSDSGGYGGGYGGGGGSKKEFDPTQFAISRNAGGARAVASTIKKPKVTAKVASNPNYKPRARGKGKLVKSKV